MNQDLFQGLSLVEQNLLMASILEALPQTVFLVDIETQKNFFVSQHIFDDLGFSKEEIEEMGDGFFEEVVHPIDLVSHKKNIDKLKHLPFGREIIHTERWKHKLGHYRWFNIHIVALKKDEMGKTTIALCINKEDVTDNMLNQSIVEKQMEQVNKASYALSHELRHEHAKILAIVRLNNKDFNISKKDFALLVNGIKQSVEMIDKSILDINEKLMAMREQFSQFKFGNSAA